MSKATTNGTATAPPETAGKGRTLLQLTEDMRTLGELLEEVGGDITSPTVAAAIDQWMAECATNQASKVEGYCTLIKEVELTACALQAEVDRLKARISVKENTAKALKTRLQWAMGEWNTRKLDTGKFLVSVQANGGKTPVEVTDEAAIPEDYFVMVPKLDSDKLRAALEAGTEVPGAKLGVKGEHLRIK